MSALRHCPSFLADGAAPERTFDPAPGPIGPSYVVTREK